jgi:hypothetical protein
MRQIVNLLCNFQRGVIYNSGSLCQLLQVPDMCLQDVSTFQNKLPMMIDEKFNSTWGIQWNFVLHDEVCDSGSQRELKDDEVS